MNAPRKLAVLLFSGMLVHCSAGPAAREIAVAGQAGSDLEALQEILPGVYSNFAWSQRQDADATVTDLRIRQLNTPGQAVFLFEQDLRGQDIFTYDLYWLKPDGARQGAQLYFTRLAEDELSLPMRDTLSIAWRRAVAGCAMPLSRDGSRFRAETSPATCVFEDPLHGPTRLSRRLTVSADTMTIETASSAAGDRMAGENTLLELQKHRVFRGWASIRVDPGQQQGEPGAWQLSRVFELRDDGRVNQLYDQQMATMDFGLQVARQQRIDGEPDYYKVSVINLENGQTQAYQWFEPGSKFLNLNFDWVQASLEPAGQEDTQP